MRQLADYVAAHGITVEVLEGPNWATEAGVGAYLWEHHAYELKLVNTELSTEMTLPWKQGIGITEDPDEHPERILDCLISDSWSYETAGSFEEWADEFGYDTDSRRAESTYRAVEKTANAFLDFIGGKPELEKLVLKYERL